MNITPFPKLFPHHLRGSILDVLKHNPFFSDAIKCRGLCISATNVLIRHLDFPPYGSIEDYMVGTNDPLHVWAHIEGWNIDLTARQFNPNDDCPKIWRSRKDKYERIELKLSKPKIL